MGSQQAKIIELKPKSRALSPQTDVSGKLSDFTHAFDLLDRAELMTTYYRFTSRREHGMRIWDIDGVSVDGEDFAEHLRIWLKERAFAGTKRKTAPILSITHAAFQMERIDRG